MPVIVLGVEELGGLVIGRVFCTEYVAAACVIMKNG